MFSKENKLGCHAFDSTALFCYEMRMKPGTRNILALLLIGGMAGVFIFGGFYLLYWQKSGTPTMVTVTSCQKVRRAPVCRGSWMVDGRVKLGIIENANSRHLGQRLEARAMGDRALIPGLRLPIILFVVGGAFALLGARWWIKEAPRSRR